jgi:hypothetical protein
MSSEAGPVSIDGDVRCGTQDRDDIQRDGDRSKDSVEDSDDACYGFTLVVALFRPERAAAMGNRLEGVE